MAFIFLYVIIGLLWFYINWVLFKKFEMGNGIRSCIIPGLFWPISMILAVEIIYQELKERTNREEGGLDE